MTVPEVPGTHDAAYLGFALVTELINVLIESKAISDDEVDAMLRRLVARSDASTNFRGQIAGKFIREQMLSEK